MTLGQRIRQIRQEKGISQRQLCSGIITRNMLSLIENDVATPSLDTLRFLSEQLQTPVSYFLDEQVSMSSNQAIITDARLRLGRGDTAGVLEVLKDYRKPDPALDNEKALLELLACIALAEDVISQEKYPYAQELLDRAAEAGKHTIYYSRELERRRLLALAQFSSVELPVDDGELLVRAEKALQKGDFLRGTQYLEAAEEKKSLKWNYLMGKAYYKQHEYNKALTYLKEAWEYAPKDCAAYLECCCRELEDFKGAYHYACLLRDMG